MFEGEVVLVYLIDPPEAFTSGIAIVNPEVQDHYGRNFITGTVPRDANDWTSGLRVGVALDQVAHFLEFPDERDFSQRNASALPVCTERPYNKTMRNALFCALPLPCGDCEIKAPTAYDSFSVYSR
jgi:hypothetical protein